MKCGKRDVVEDERDVVEVFKWFSQSFSKSLPAKFECNLAPNSFQTLIVINESIEFLVT